MKGEIAKAHVVLTPSAEPNADGILTLCRGRADAEQLVVGARLGQQAGSQVKPPLASASHGFRHPDALAERAGDLGASAGSYGGAYQWAVAVGVHSRRGSGLRPLVP